MCLTTANNNPIVACPECGEGNAFDTDRPIVSRAYLSLVTKMKMEVLSSNCDKSGSITAMNDSKSGNNKMECTTQQLLNFVLHALHTGTPTCMN